MGGPNIKRKGTKRLTQKKKRKGRVSQKTLSNCEGRSSPLLFSEESICTNQASPPNVSAGLHPAEAGTFVYHADDVNSSNESYSCNDSEMVGDRDMDLVEMELYDNYRRTDGEPYPTEYLLKCRKKLKTKVHKCLEKINTL